MNVIKFKLVSKTTKQALGFEYLTADGWKNDIFNLGERNGCFDQRGLGADFFGIVQRLVFTGIFDKTGAEIYEGDIIDGMTVAYCGDQAAGLGMNCGFYLQTGNFEKWIALQSRHNDNGDNYLVTGNIHIS